MKLKTITISIGRWIALTLIATVIGILFGPPIAKFIETLGNGFIYALLSSIAWSAASMSVLELMNKILGIVIGALAGYFIFFVLKTMHTIKKIESFYTTVSIETPIDDREHKIEELSNELAKLKYAEPAERRKIKRLKKITISSFIFIIIMCLLLIPTMIIPLQYKIVYDKSIEKISPYISSAEILQLNSDWVRMQSHDDFLKIKDHVDKICKDNNLN